MQYGFATTVIGSMEIIQLYPVICSLGILRRIGEYVGPPTKLIYKS